MIGRLEVFVLEEFLPMLSELLADELLEKHVVNQCSDTAPQYVINMLRRYHITYDDKTKDYFKIAYQVKEIYKCVDWTVDSRGNHTEEAIGYMALLEAICGIRYANKFQCLIMELP